MPTKKPDVLDELAPRKVPVDRLIRFGAVGLVAASFPAFLYYSKLDMGLSQIENVIAFLVALLATAGVLAYAYEKGSFLLRERMLKERQDALSLSMVKKPGMDEKHAREKLAKLKSKQSAVTELEASAWTVFQTNVLYLLPALFLGFYALRSAPLLLNFVVSNAASLALVVYVARKLK